MSLTSLVFGLATKKAAQRFEAATLDTTTTQRELILAMIRKNAETEYGRKHGFGSIETLDDWQREVPIISYEDIKADMTRVTEGAQGVFTVEDPIMFAQTSGTTGDPKYIPLTPSCQGQAQGDVMRTWLHTAQRAHPDIFSSKILSLVSPAIEGHVPSGVPFGSMSGQMYRDQNWLVRRAYPIPYPVFEIADYEAKYYAIMRAGVAADVRLLVTANPSSVLKMSEKADQFAEEIIRDVRDGTLSQNFDIEPEIRRTLTARFKPDPGRAKELADARSLRGGKLLPADYWKRLSLIGCWKGGTVGHYVDKFGDWFDPDGTRPIPVRDMGYLSSEVRGSVPLSDEGSEGALTIAGNFFEFVEVDDLESKKDDWSSWNVFTADQIEVGKEYYIFVSTTGGLYRYDINDVIRVEGHYNTDPQIVFLRKGRGMTNITGEKVSVNQVILSVQLASKATGTVPGHFKAEADIARGRYLFRVEFATQVDDTHRKAFLRALDDNLKAINIEYKAKRDSERLNAPILHVMREGWYERARRAQAAAGKRVFQAKTEVLTANKALTMDIKPELEAIVEMSD
ncbi:MAG: GH3 auxin-responsive promoter family protein [Planctomycetota bacterium]|nr:MAG: GH3 auxin-responsive promoter family protein [Planctomycetota bacterium]